MTTRICLLLTLTLVVAACASVPDEERVARTVTTLEAAPVGDLHGKVIATEKPSLTVFEAIPNAARDARVIYVGEMHTNLEHHATQLRVVQALWRQDRKIAIGMEMFFRPFQQHLDDYVARRIDEETMLRRTEWFTRWRFGWYMYAPILRFARAKGIPVVALNIPSEITRTVARQGLDALTPEQRAEIPDLDLGNEEHRAFVKAVFLGGHELPPDRFENFYTSMCVWDDGMAESVVRYLRGRDGRDRRMVVVVGAGHVRRRFGIPDRVERRTGWKQVVAVPLEVREGQEVDWAESVSNDEGDYLYITAPAAVSMRKQLGVGVVTENPPDDGIGIASVTPMGAAAGAGVQKDDVILTLGRRAMTDLVALKLFLEEAERGRSYRLILRRGEERITTALVLPTRPPHPPMRRMP